MSGLRKAKQYDWKDSNMALFGSDEDKKVKKESAETEPAWQGAGQEVGLRIWRIVKFQVEDWPKEDYGEFYDGDSYIILNTYKKDDSDELHYDVHFWIGKYSTQDEYGTAAYKTVELDTFLDDKAVQHREVDRNESKLFLSYFDQITKMKGGADTGFRHVEPEEYQPRLLKFCKIDGKVQMTEKSLKRSKLNSGDVFVLDNGMNIIQWNGNDCQNVEKFSAAQAIASIKSNRGGKPETESVEEGDMTDDHPFYEALTVPDDEEDSDDEGEAGDPTGKVMMRIHSSGGETSMDNVEEGSLTRENLDSGDVFLVDTGFEVFVWVGSGANEEEKKNGLPYACNYINNTTNPCRPISVIKEGQENEAFDGAF